MVDRVELSLGGDTTNMNFDQRHTYTHEHAASTHRHTNMHLQKTDSKMHLQGTCHHGHTTRRISPNTSHHTRTTQYLPSHRSSAATILKNSEPFQHDPEAWRTLRVLSVCSPLTSPRAASWAVSAFALALETLGFAHLHLDVTMSRVIIFRGAILDLFSVELGAIVFVKTHFSGRP